MCTEEDSGTFAVSEYINDSMTTNTLVNDIVAKVFEMRSYDRGGLDLLL